MEIVTEPRSSLNGTLARRANALRDLADALERTNDAVERAVEAGLTVELVRKLRYHNGRGNWGDQMRVAEDEAPN